MWKAIKQTSLEERVEHRSKMFPLFARDRFDHRLRVTQITTNAFTHELHRNIMPELAKHSICV